MNCDYRKRELKRCRVRPQRIAAAYQKLRERELLQRQWKWEVRAAFFALSGAGTGQRYKARYRRAFAEGDVTYLPGFDVLARELAAHFPELDGDDCTQRLFELIRQPVDRMPPAEETYRRAVDLLLDRSRVTGVPF